MTPVDVDMLSAYFDGELSPAEAARVERRIADDPAWAAAMAELRSLDGVLDAYECPAMPRGLPSRIVAAARRLDRPVWVRALRLAGPMAAAAAVVLAVVLVGPWRSGGDLASSNGLANGTHHAGEAPAPRLAQADVDDLARSQLFFFSNMETIQTLADNEQLLNADTMDALAKLEAPVGFIEPPRSGSGR